MAVGQPVSGLVHQRQGCHLGEPLVLILAQRDLRVGPGDRAAHRERVGQAAAMGHQVIDGDRASRSDGDVQRTGGVGKNPHIGQLRQPSGDGIRQCEPALIDQRHRGGDRHRLGHGGDAEDGVPAHRQLGFDISLTDLVDLQHIPPMPHQRHRAGDQPGVDGLGDRGPVVVEAHRQESTQRIFGC